MVLAWQDGDATIALAPGDRRWVGDGLGLRRLAWLTSPYPAMRWQGQAASAMAPHLWRRWVVWVGAEPELLGMAARAAIAYPLQLRGIAAAEIERRTEFWAERLALPPTVWGVSPLALAREQQKQVALVRALAIEPPVLLCDRPGLYLSPALGDRFRQALVDLPESIVVVHDDPSRWPGWLPLTPAEAMDDF
ncbi:MAG: hypothetical protein HC918_10430 [Oscillatoriales cyanobacterium SM2_1_8]|nr:hypothetical protein [Oscillatoriales cyanobacterium SM2_1_8]